MERRDPADLNFPAQDNLDQQTILDLIKSELNDKAKNHCWLNSTIQLLWHIDAFRQAITRINGHYE